MGAFISVLAFVITIGIIVIIHEGGHLFAAKRLGIAADRFSVGMGPVCWKRTRGGTEYVVSALPVGGYVRFVEAGDELVTSGKIPRERVFEWAPRWKKAIVIAAGPLLNFILAFVLYAAMGAIGQEDLVPTVSPKPGSVAEAAGVRPMDRIVEIGGARTAGVTEVNTELMLKLGDAAVPVVLDRGGTRFETTLDLSDVTLSDAAKTGGMVLPLAGLRLTGTGVRIGGVEPGSPAEAAGLKAGDAVGPATGESLSIEDFIALVRAHPEEPVTLRVRPALEGFRLGEARDVVLTPAVIERDGRREGRIGAMLYPDLKVETMRYGPLESVRHALHKVWGMTVIQFVSVKGMTRGEVKAENLSGPVGIAEMAGRTMSAGLVAFIDFIALISVAVGFMNLIPIPALDGGQLVLLGVESVIRRPIPGKVRGWLSGASLAIILAIAVFATVNDVERLLGG